MPFTGASWLIYHPRRQCRVLDSCTVYCDSTVGNQDPYVWSEPFLHSYCHITQMHSEIGGIHLWVSGDTFPEFDHLYCDLVFVVAEKQQWRDANNMEPDDPIVDSPEAFNDHYRWHVQHPFARRKRYTLKADPDSSFQPQTADAGLVDIVPLLASQGMTLSQLRAAMRAGTGSQPVRLNLSAAGAIADQLSRAPILLTGLALQQLRVRHPELASKNRGPDTVSPGQVR